MKQLRWRAVKTWYEAGFWLVVAGIAFAQAPAKRAPAVRYMVEASEVGRVSGAVTYELSCPNLEATQWLVYAASAPELPSQVKVKSAMVPVTSTVKELGPLGRPLLGARVAVTDPRLIKQLPIKVTYEATLIARTLKPLEPGAKPPRVATLPAAARKAFTSEHGDLDFSQAVFVAWLKEHKLVREKGEEEIEFARRVFQGICADFRYEYRTDLNRAASHVCASGNSDCGGLATLFVATMRANQVPARLLVGRWAKSAKSGETLGGVPYFQWHVKSEFFADGVGWVPLDISHGVEHDKSPERLTYFGVDPGDFLTFHIDRDFIVDAGQFGQKPVSQLQNPVFWASGKGSVDPLGKKEDWQVTKVDGK